MTKGQRFQIIATLGPAVKGKTKALIQNGATGFRLNCSHLSWSELSRWLVELEDAFSQHGDSMPVWLDLQGGKMRIGKLKEKLVLKEGGNIRFQSGYTQTEEAIPLPHSEVFQLIDSGDTILIDDGKIELIVKNVKHQEFDAEILIGGEISSFKGFLIKNKFPQFKEVSDRDKGFIEQTQQLKFVGYAVSYLKSAGELKIFTEFAPNKSFTAKIERTDAFQSLYDIAEIADCTWLCRGDLGTFAHVYELYNLEKEFASKMSVSGKPYLIAGQVLENMVSKKMPSRSEIAHLGFLVEHGFSGVVLSDETAVGEHPINAVAFCQDYFEYIAD